MPNGIAILRWGPPPIGTVEYRWGRQKLLFSAYIWL